MRGATANARATGPPQSSSQKAERGREIDNADTRFGLRPAQQGDCPCLGLLGLLPGRAQHHEVVRVTDKLTGAAVGTGEPSDAGDCEHAPDLRLGRGLGVAARAEREKAS